MIYCPKCGEIVNNIICDNCSVDVFNYMKQKYEVFDEHVDELRSGHRIMKNLNNNQKLMISILNDEITNNNSYILIYKCKNNLVYRCKNNLIYRLVRSRKE